MLVFEIEVAASLAHWGFGEGHAVGMTANGTLAHADQPFRIMPGRSPNQLTRILEALAAVSYFVSSSFDRFLIEESPRLPWGATMVLITPYTNEAIAGTILRLRDSGRRLVLISLGHDEPLFIDRLLTYHLPIAEEQPLLPPEDSEEDEKSARESAGDPYANLTPRQRYLLRRVQEKEAEHGQ
jgi:uncharacterized protein (DUF58 family)